MSLEKRITLMKAFIRITIQLLSLADYFRTLDNKINNIHEKALMTIYSDYRSSNELLNKDV